MLVQQLKARLLKRYLLRYPLELRQARYEALSGLKWFKQTLAKIQPEVLPIAIAPPFNNPVAQNSPHNLPGIQAQPSYYNQYRCLGSAPLHCGIPWETLQADPTAKQCSRCHFPTPLLKGEKIIGKRGTYEVNHSLGQRGLGRLYSATETGSGQSVTLKEFLLPPLYFKPQTKAIRLRQETFINLAGFALADGRSQDLRVAAPLEAITNVESPQLFLVTPQADSYPSLNQVLAFHGPLSQEATKRLLNQVLQTLSFLHQQKFTLPMGQLKTGIVHGNLSLNSLIWVDDSQDGQTEPRDDQKLALGKNFFIHLTDFLLWEQLFNPASIDMSLPEVEDDFSALGYIAFYALNGSVSELEPSDVRSRQRPAKALNPRLDAHWPQKTQPQLRQFLRQLMGLEGSFETATTARQALLNIPDEPVSNRFAPPDQPSSKPSWWSIYGPYLLMLGGLATVASLLWLIVLKPKSPSLAEAPGPPCCLSEVGGLGLEPYRYGSVANSSWQRLLQVAESQDAPQPNLLSQLILAQPKLNLSYQPSRSIEGAIADLQSGKIDFAILPQITELPEGLTATTIAYDGIAAFVAFNYTGRDRGLPEALKGNISPQGLQQLYSGTVQNWNSLSRSELPSQVYWPDDPVAIQQFNQKILQWDAEHLAEAGLALEATGNHTETFLSASLPIGEMLRETIRDFESRGVGAVGFAPLSALLGQCSVYPLAIATPEGPMQALVMEDGKPIDPGVDLCDRKGSYGPDGDLLRDGRYPLAYGLAVVYPMDNSRPDIGKRFAELLLTEEGQSLLERAGFIKAYPLNTGN